MHMRRKPRFFTCMAFIFSFLLGLVLCFPIFYGVMAAFKTEAEFAAFPPRLFPAQPANFSNFSAVLSQLPVMRFFLNSVIVSTLAASVRILLALLAAYAFAFYQFRGKRFLFFLLLGTMMLPPDTIVVTNYQTVSRLGLIDSYLGMAIVSFVGASQMLMLRQAFLSSPPPLREAAQMDGCGDLRFLFYILLPTVIPILLTLFIQSFVTVWNAYLWPLLVTNRTDMRTLQIGITMLSNPEDTDYPMLLAGVTLSLIPAFLLFIPLRKRMLPHITEGSLVE